MAGSPSIAALVAAVRGFLEETAMVELTGRSAFHARVAANVLSIVERELALGPAASAAATRRLADLLGRDAPLEELERELCARIRSGALGPDSAALMEHLHETTLARLAIDQPGYAGYRRALEQRERATPQRDAAVRADEPHDARAGEPGSPATKRPRGDRREGPQR